VSEMVERVARAIHDMHSAGPAYELAADDWRDMARAAIEAMREPTEEMVATHDKHVLSYCIEEDAWITPDDAKANWSTMIDEALK